MKTILRTITLKNNIVPLEALSYLALHEDEDNAKRILTCGCDYSQTFHKCIDGPVPMNTIKLNNQDIPSSVSSPRDLFRYLSSHFLNCCYNDDFNELENNGSRSTLGFFCGRGKPCVIFGCNGVDNLIAKNTIIKPIPFNPKYPRVELLCQYGWVINLITDTDKLAGEEDKNFVAEPYSFRHCVREHESTLDTFEYRCTFNNTSYHISFDKSLKAEVAKLKFTRALPYLIGFNDLYNSYLANYRFGKREFFSGYNDYVGMLKQTGQFHGHGDLEPEIYKAMLIKAGKESWVVRLNFWYFD